MLHATLSRFQINFWRIFICSVALAANLPAQTTINTATTAPITLNNSTPSNNTLAVTGVGSITLPTGSSSVAVTVTKSGTVTNLGTIQHNGTASGQNGRAIRDNTGGLILTINNGSSTNSTALLQTADADVVQMNVAGSTVTLNNYGTINSQNLSAKGNQAIDWAALNTTVGGNALYNYATGKITVTEADAVRPGVNGFIYNYGLIKSTTGTGSSSDGIDLQTNTGVQITNYSSGLVQGGRHGITGGPATDVFFDVSVANNAGGTIQGDNGSGINMDGFGIKQTATIINNGTITGNGVTGDGDGIDVDGFVNIVNTGTIRSINAFNAPAAGIAYSEGVTMGAGGITNTGTIEGLVAPGNSNAVGRGITLAGNDITSGPLAGTREAIYGNITITNMAGGLIRGQSDSGIYVDGPASGHFISIDNQAGATIQGGGTANAAIRTGSDNDTITNSGTIDGSSSGKAVDLGGGANTLNYNGGTIIGTINGGTGSNNTLNLGTGVTHSFGTQNFQNINVASGSSSLVGIVSGINLTKSGSGTLALSAANTYSGTTTVTAGMLKVNNTVGSGTGSSSVLVQSGAKLGGSGTISGPVTVDGIIAPGNSIGTLNVGNNVTWNGSVGNNWNFELGAGNASDRLNITGDFLKGSGNSYNFDFLGSVDTGTFVLVDWSNSSNFLASDFSYLNLGAGLTGSFALNGSQLEFTAIPEPATTGLFAGAGVLAFVMYLRRRRAVLA